MLIIKYKYEQQPVRSLAALTLKWHLAGVFSLSGDPNGNSLSCKLRIAADLVPGDPRGTDALMALFRSFFGFPSLYVE